MMYHKKYKILHFFFLLLKKVSHSIHHSSLSFIYNEKFIYIFFCFFSFFSYYFPKKKICSEIMKFIRDFNNIHNFHFYYIHYVVCASCNFSLFFSCFSLIVARLCKNSIMLKIIHHFNFFLQINPFLSKLYTFVSHNS
jgi:hypothetical protein